MQIGRCFSTRSRLLTSPVGARNTTRRTRRNVLNLLCSCLSPSANEACQHCIEKGIRRKSIQSMPEHEKHERATAVQPPDSNALMAGKIQDTPCGPSNPNRLEGGALLVAVSVTELLSICSLTSFHDVATVLYRHVEWCFA